MMNFILLLLLIPQILFSQNLQEERIWKLVPRKTSVYLDKGIFHFPSSVKGITLNSVRSSFVKDRGYERVVFDFSGNNPPKIYGHLSSDKRKVYLDFFDTKLGSSVSSFKAGKFAKGLDFYNIDADNLSIELQVNGTVVFDIFYLENPARLVIDIKE